jgi:hypothetical protein
MKITKQIAETLAAYVAATRFANEASERIDGTEPSEQYRRLFGEASRARQAIAYHRERLDCALGISGQTLASFDREVAAAERHWARKQRAAS